VGNRRRILVSELSWRSNIFLRKLDELGVDYIEGGWPGSNPKDMEFFDKTRDLKLKKAL
jgi:isopropylmalate/homocitrate/citramalate synthase